MRKSPTPTAPLDVGGKRIGRVAYPCNFIVTTDENLLERCNEAAWRDRSSRAAFVRNAIEFYIAANHPDLANPQKASA